MIYYFSIVASILFFIIILNLVRKRKLDEKYSILWVIFSIVILLVSIFPSSITKVANIFGVYYPPSLLFLFGFVILCIYIVHITIVITKQNKMIVKLTQELGILIEKKQG